MILSAYKTACRLRDKLAVVLFRSAFRHFGAKSTIALPFRSGGESRISVGSGVYIGTNSWLEVMNAKEESSLAIIIEDNVSISGFCTITAVSEVRIGRSALIARFVHISDHSHATGDSGLPIKDQGVTKVAPVRIGEGAWIGHGAVICPGVTIGRNAVIGANSVVREDVPDFGVAVGAPARLVGPRAKQTPAIRP